MRPCHCIAAGIACATGKPIAAYINAGELDKAYQAAGAALIENPHCWQAHYGFASAVMAQHRAPFALDHLLTAIALQKFHGKPDVVPLLYTELGRVYLQSGRLEEAKAAFEYALKGKPDFLPAKAGLHDVTGKLTSTGERQHNGHSLLDEGRRHELEGDYAKAWDCYTRAKADLTARGFTYPKEATETRFAAYRKQCTRATMNLLSRVAKDLMRRPQAFEDLKPVFILGYPRSGTTLLEQILSCSDHVTAGDELPFVVETVNAARLFTGSAYPYPWCLSELLAADTKIALANMRHHYLARVVERLGIDASPQWLTDKMPLNECYLPLLHLMFPAAPKILIKRHPLDVLVSNFCLHLTHGVNQANDVKTCAAHILLVNGLVTHYRAKIEGLNLLTISYEKLVSEPETVIPQLCAYAKIPFDLMMLTPQHNPRFAQTASYAQVREPITTKAIGRWRRFEPQLREALAGTPAMAWFEM